MVIRFDEDMMAAARSDSYVVCVCVRARLGVRRFGKLRRPDAAIAVTVVERYVELVCL